MFLDLLPPKRKVSISFRFLSHRVLRFHIVCRLTQPAAYVCAFFSMKNDVFTTSYVQTFAVKKFCALHEQGPHCCCFNKTGLISKTFLLHIFYGQIRTVCEINHLKAPLRLFAILFTPILREWRMECSTQAQSC